MTLAKEQLGNLLAPVERPEAVDSTRVYRLLGARWYAQGLFVKDEKSGQNIKANTLYRVKAGDFVYNRLFAWKGSFAIAGDEADDCYVSNEFPCFAINRLRLDPSYLKWWFSRESAWLRALGLSTGATPTSRNRLKEQHLLGMEIWLPRLDEQRRVVARIEELVAKLTEAQQLRLLAQNEQSAVFRQALKRLFDVDSPAWTGTTVNDIAHSLDAGWSPQCENTPADSEHWGVLKTTAVQWCEFWPEENKRLPPSAVVRPDLAVKTGDVLVTRAGPMKRVGVPATVRQDHPKLMISDKLIRIRPMLDKIDPRFLEYALSSPQAQEHLVARKTGLADAQVNISQSILRATPFAYPALDEQKQIVAELDFLQTKIGAVKSLQEEAAAELDAMLPAILDKAFKGEL